MPNIKLTDLKLFSAGDTPPEVYERRFASEFLSEFTKRIYFQLHFKQIDRNYSTTINYKIYDPDGEVFTHYAVPIEMQKGWDKCWTGHGWSTPGNWRKGRYRYEVSVGNSDVKKGVFVIK